MTTVLTMPIRFTDLDALGHVNHAKYLTYGEEFRVTALSILDVQCPDGPRWSGSSVLAKAAIEYRLPIEIGSRQVGVNGEVLKVGRSSVHMRNEVLAGGEVCAVIEVVLVRIGPDGRAGAMSPAQQQWWSQFLSTPEEPRLVRLDLDVLEASEQEVAR